MVKPEMLKRLSKRLSELCEEHGVASNLAVVPFIDNECDVEISKDLANERREALNKVCDELRKVDGVLNIFDNGKDKVLRGVEVRRFEILVKDDQWTETEEDERKSDEFFDDDLRDKEDAKRRADKKKYWREYILPLPEPDGSDNTEIYLTMGYEPYDWIKDGWIENGKRVYKRTEFRPYTERYAKRLLSHPLKTVKFQRGYGGRGRPKPEQMVFEVKSITLWDSRDKIECDPRHLKDGIVPDFFAINLGRRIR